MGHFEKYSYAERGIRVFMPSAELCRTYFVFPKICGAGMRLARHSSPCSSAVKAEEQGDGSRIVFARKPAISAVSRTDVKVNYLRIVLRTYSKRRCERPDYAEWSWADIRTKDRKAREGLTSRHLLRTAIHL